MDHSEKHEGGGWRCGGDKTSQPWKPKKAEAEWALVAPTWNSSIWMAEAEGDSWKSEANLGYTVYDSVPNN